eukprot:GHVS01035307.1.p1 GENE.GHVS01035307.1~~GHVS01035307.1.p1  ORF type:complete len:162 (+),score=55.75 GHVS01035307.1:39-488(+)
MAPSVPKASAAAVEAMPPARKPSSSSSLGHPSSSSSTSSPRSSAGAAAATPAAAAAAGTGGRATLHVVFLESDGGKSTFKVSTRTKVCRVVEAYCGTRSYARDGVRFVLNGKRLKVSGDEGQMTTEEAGIEDGDVIDVFRIQTGGMMMV